MTPRQIALLKEAVRHDGYMDHDDTDDVNDLCDKGYLVETFGQTCEITAEGREALRNAREW